MNDIATLISNKKGNKGRKRLGKKICSNVRDCL